MARIYAHRHGKSHPTRPTSKRVPSWVTYAPDELVTLIVKLAKDGVAPSHIGQRLRDAYNIPLVQPILGKSIAQVLAENNLRPSLPESLTRLLDRARRLQTHLARYPADHKNIHSLELLESKIHRLAKHYRRTGDLAPDWKYRPVVAQLA